MSDTSTTSSPQSENAPIPRPSPFTVVGRAFRLRCPRCGEGQLFNGLFSMPDTCGHCGLPILREPGFYLGSIYVNYGWTAIVSTVSWVVLRFKFGIPSNTLLIGFVPFAILFPILFFKHARALWLALDVNLDSSNFDPPPDGSSPSAE